MGLVYTSTTVGTTVITVVPASTTEYSFIAISNNGANTVFLKMAPATNTLTVSNGIALASGAAILLDQDVTPILVSGVSAVCDSNASTTVAVQAY